MNLRGNSIGTDGRRTTTTTTTHFKSFHLLETEHFRKELSPSETHFFRPRDFGKRSFSEILDQCCDNESASCARWWSSCAWLFDKYCEL